MDHKVNLKLGEVNNLSDARFAAGIGAQFLGFNFTPGSEKYVSPTQAEEFIGWLEGPKIVGEWDNGLAETIWDTAERLKLDYTQLNFFDAEICERLQELCLIQNIILDSNSKIAEVISKINSVEKYVTYFMFSFESENAQNDFLHIEAHQKMLQQLCRDFPVFFNFHFTEKNILPLVDQFSPFGINLKGSHEIKPGYKDFDELNELVDLLEIE